MQNEPRIHHVVFHNPGPAWQPGIDFREQPGVGDHVAHYAQVHERGQLELGGPYLGPKPGGMMVATADVTAEALDEIAAADPAVTSGLLIYEIRPWMVAMAAQA